MERIRVLIADDHPGGLCTLLQVADRAQAIVREAGMGQQSTKL